MDELFSGSVYFLVIFYKGLYGFVDALFLCKGLSDPSLALESDICDDVTAEW